MAWKPIGPIATGDPKVLDPLLEQKACQRSLNQSVLVPVGLLLRQPDHRLSKLGGHGVVKAHGSPADDSVALDPGPWSWQTPTAIQGPDSPERAMLEPCPQSGWGETLDNETRTGEKLGSTPLDHNP